MVSRVVVSEIVVSGRVETFSSGGVVVRNPSSGVVNGVVNGSVVVSITLIVDVSTVSTVD